MRVWIGLCTRTATADRARDSIAGTEGGMGDNAASATTDRARDSIARAEVCRTGDGENKKGGKNCRTGHD